MPRLINLSWLQVLEDSSQNLKNALFLFSIGLYIDTIIPPSWESLNYVNITEQSKQVLLITGLIFSLAIFGLLHHIARIIRGILSQLAIAIEFDLFKRILEFLGIKIKDKTEKYWLNPNIVNVSDIEKYLINNEHPKIQKIYDDRQEIIKNNSLSKLYAVEIVLLLLIQLKFNLVLFKYLNEIAQAFDFPIVKAITIVCIVLTIYASRPYPDSWDFFYIPNNPILSQKE